VLTFTSYPVAHHGATGTGGVLVELADILTDKSRLVVPRSLLRMLEVPGKPSKIAAIILKVLQETQYRDGLRCCGDFDVDLKIGDCLITLSTLQKVSGASQKHTAKKWLMEAANGLDWTVEPLGKNDPRVTKSGIPSLTPSRIPYGTPPRTPSGAHLGILVTVSNYKELTFIPSACKINGSIPSGIPSGIPSCTPSGIPSCTPSVPQNQHRSTDTALTNTKNQHKKREESTISQRYNKENAVGKDSVTIKTLKSDDTHRDLLSEESDHGEVARIFMRWGKVWNVDGNTHLDEDVESIVRKARQNFSTEELYEAIDGSKLDDWEFRPTRCDLTDLFKSNKRIRIYRELARSTPQGCQTLQQQLEVLAD